MESNSVGPQAGLTSIEKAWTMPIPAELTQRQAARCAPPRNFNEATSEEKPKTEADSKKQVKTEPVDQNATPMDHSSSTTPEKTSSSTKTAPTKPSSAKTDKQSSSSNNSGPNWLMNEMESNVLRTLQNNSNALTPFQKAELERLRYLQKCTEYFKKHVKTTESNVPTNDLFQQTNEQTKPAKETDYAKELSVVKGRRVPGLSAPTEFSHSITANELIK